MLPCNWTPRISQGRLLPEPGADVRAARSTARPNLILIWQDKVFRYTLTRVNFTVASTVLRLHCISLSLFRV